MISRYFCNARVRSSLAPRVTARSFTQRLHGSGGDGRVAALWPTQLPSAMQSRGFEIARRAAPSALCEELRRSTLLAAREQQRQAFSWLAALRRRAGLAAAGCVTLSPAPLTDHTAH